MGNGRWAMGNGKWAMGNGQWAMGNGQWAMGKTLNVSYKITAIGALKLLKGQSIAFVFLFRARQAEQQHQDRGFGDSHLQ